PLTGSEVLDAGRQGGLVHEDVPAIVTGEEPEPLVLLVPLHATRGHRRPHLPTIDTPNLTRLAIRSGQPNRDAVSARLWVPRQPVAEPGQIRQYGVGPGPAQPALAR